MPIRKCKTPTRATRKKRARNAARSSMKPLPLVRNVICLASYRGARNAQPDIAVGDGLDRSLPLKKGHSAQIMLFTGVQIVRDIGNE